jgi:hypothetical protein
MSYPMPPGWYPGPQGQPMWWDGRQWGPPPGKPWWRQTWFIVAVVVVVLATVAAVGASLKAADERAADAADPVKLLDESGRGSKQTATFTVTHSDWTVLYTFNCGADDGYFGLASAGDDVQTLASETERRDSSTSHGHGAGTYRLHVTTVCPWRVVVTG